MAITDVTVDGGMRFKVWTTNNPWRKGALTAQVLETTSPIGRTGAGTHSALGGPTGVLMGVLGTRDLPAWIYDLPVGSPERRAAIEGWRAGQDRVAMEAIVAAHPEALGRPMDVHQVDL